MPVPNDRVPFRNKLDESANQNDAKKEKEESVFRSGVYASSLETSQVKI